MKRTLVAAAAVLTCFLTGCSNPIEEGAQLLESGNYGEAITSFEQAVEKEKDLGEAYRGLGIAYYEMEDYEKAADAFLSALANDTEKTPTIYNFLGICNMQMGEIDSAINNFELGISMAAEVAEDETDYTSVVQEMEFNAVMCYEKKLDWANAKTKMAAYIAKYPDDTNAQSEAMFLETR